MSYKIIVTGITDFGCISVCDNVSSFMYIMALWYEVCYFKITGKKVLYK